MTNRKKHQAEPLNAGSTRVLLLLCPLLALVSCDACSDSEPEAMLTEVSPQVQITRAQEDPFSAGQGSQLRAGDTVSSNSSGQATLVFASGARLKLRPSTSIVIESGEQGLKGRQVRLLFGEIEAIGQGRELIVMTRLGPIVLGGGDNKVRVKSSDQGLTVNTLIGEVRLGDNKIPEGVRFTLNKDGIVLDDNPADAGSSVDASPDLGLTEAIVIRLRSGRGVYRQQGGTGRFRPLRKGQNLSGGDVIEARKGEAVVALGDHGETRIQRRSLLGIEQNGRDLLLKRGQGRVLLKAGQSQILKVAGVLARVEADDLGAEVVVKRNKRGGQVQVKSGSAHITDSQGGELDLLPGEEARVDRKGRATRQSVADSAIKITPRLRRLYLSRAPQPMTFSWSPGSGAGLLTVEIARDPDFKLLLRRSQTRTRRLTVDDLDYGIYSWRVSGAAGPLFTSRIGLLRDRDTADRGTRANKVRASAERTVVLYQQWQHPELTFSWPARDRAVQYRLAIYVDGAFEKPVLEQNVAATQLQLPPGRLKDGRYVWAFTALGASGQNLATSDMYDLEVKFDSNNTVLRILAPQNGQRAPGGHVTARGMVTPGSSVSINGKKTRTDAQGRFETTVRVRRSSPLVLFQVGANLFVRRVRP